MALTDNLEGYWKCDEASWDGTTNEMQDSSGNGKHAHAVGATIASGGIFGNAASFGANTHYCISESAIPNIAGTKNVSMQVWVKLSAISSNKSIFRLKYPAQIDSMAASYRARFVLAFDPYPNVSSTVNVGDSNWHHLVGTYDGTKIHFYIDGSEIGTGTAFTEVLGSAGDEKVYFGTDPAENLCAVGLMDEFAIWSRALTSDEVITLYNGGAGYDMLGGGSTSIKGLISSGIIQSPR
jgi:hypothetical protein